MPFPLIAAAIGAQALGSAFGAFGQSRAQSKAQKEDRRQFDLQYGLDREKFGYQRDTDTQDRKRRAALDPAKQQMLAALMQRLGLGGAAGGLGATPGFNPQAAPPPAAIAPQMPAQPAPPMGAPAGALAGAPAASMMQNPQALDLLRRLGLA